MQHKTLAKNESRQSCGERQSFEAYEGTGCRFAHAKKLELVHFYGGRLVEKSDAPTPNHWVDVWSLSLCVMEISTRTTKEAAPPLLLTSKKRWGVLYQHQLLPPHEPGATLRSQLSTFSLQNHKHQYGKNQVKINGLNSCHQININLNISYQALL